MAEETNDLTTAELDAKIAAARARIGMASPKGSAGKRKTREKKAKQQINRNLLRRTGRSELFTFRCRADLIAQMKAMAKKEGGIAHCMEEAIEAWLKTKETGNSGANQR